MAQPNFTHEMASELTRLVSCLASSERQVVLFDRIFEGDPDDLEELGNLNEESATLGINWWAENESILISICQRFADSLILTGQEIGISIGEFLERWNLDSWADFISETYDCWSGFGRDEDFDYFFDYAVRQPLGFNTRANDEGETIGNRGLEVTNEDWELLTSVFQAWWKKDEIGEILTFTYEVTESGRKLINALD